MLLFLWSFDFGLKDLSPEYSSNVFENTKVKACFNHRILWW